MQNFPKSLAELKLESGDVVFQDVCVLYLQMYFIVWPVNLIIFEC